MAGGRGERGRGRGLHLELAQRELGVPGIRAGGAAA